MRFIVLAENPEGERTVMLVVAEDMASALYSLAADAAKTGSDILNGECTIIPAYDQPGEMGVNIFEDEEKSTIQSFLSGHLQRVNICSICICENCNPGLCESDGYSGRPMECYKERCITTPEADASSLLKQGIILRVAQEQ